MNFSTPFNVKKQATLGAACMLAGAVFGAVFHLTELWAITIKLLCLAAIFACTQRSPHWRAALGLGWAWGTGATLTGMGWLYIAMHDVGGLPSVLAAVAMVLFALLLGVFNGISTATSVWFWQKTSRRTPLAPPFGTPHDMPFKTSTSTTKALPFVACWALGEWLRTWVLTGLPWMSVGYGFLDTPFTSAAPFLGVLGVGAAAVALAVCLARLLNQQRFKAMLYGVALVAASQLAQHWTYTAPFGAPLSVALLQGNVPQTLKFDPTASQRYMQRYADLAAQSTAQLTLLPETALPNLLSQLPPPVLATLAAVPHTLLLGTIGQTNSADPLRYTNRLTTPYATNPWVYDKIHLVPFGEAIPTGFQWFVDLMNMPLSSLGQGAQEQTNLTVNGIVIAANICYEEIFAHEWRARGASAHILLNASNFGWYGDTAVLPQHTGIARMRALEFQKPYLSATNNGSTLAVLPTGAVQAQLPKNTIGTLKVTVQGMAGQTPYSQWGDWGVVGLALFSLIVLAAQAHQRAPRKEANR